MESISQVFRDRDKMLDEEDLVDPESAVQFSAVLKEMQNIFHRTEGNLENLSEKQGFLTGVNSWGEDVSKLDVLLTAPPSWRLETKSCRSQTSSREISSNSQGEGPSVFDGQKFCENNEIQDEGGCDVVRNSYHLCDEDGETGYHSMTTNSSDSSSLDSLSPSPTTDVYNVRALPSSFSPMITKCPLLRLPDELLVNQLLSLLSPRDLVRFSSSCRRLQRLCW